MKIKIQDAEKLVTDGLKKIGYSGEDTAIITDHIIDAELRGYGVAGLARILSIRDRLGGRAPQSQIDTTKEAGATAQLDGNDALGYLVAYKATRVAIEKAKAVGVAVVGASNTWYTGMLSYYAEMAAAEDLVTVIASNANAFVAPEGGARPMLGTNPFAAGFPSGTGVPIIYDIGTSKIIHADVMLARRLGRDLPEGSAINAKGEFTVSPHEAFEGALAIWGGHKGTGLSIVVQLLGVMAGSPASITDLKEFGFCIIAINPAMFRPIEEFKNEVDEFSEKMRACPPAPGKPALRMPFQRSNEKRDACRKAGEFEVEDGVVERLKALIAESS